MVIDHEGVSSVFVYILNEVMNESMNDLKKLEHLSLLFHDRYQAQHWQLIRFLAV